MMSQARTDASIAAVQREVESARLSVKAATGRAGLRQLATVLEREAEMLREELRRSREVGYETAEE